MKKFIFLAVFSMGILTAAAQIYVNSNAAPGGDGSNWQFAYQNLQQAINAAQSGDQIWVAAGTHTPTQLIPGTSGNQHKSFYIANKNITIYGGFSGTEFSFSQRNPNNRSVLNGDEDIILIVESENIILDGFEINGNIFSKYGVTINGEFLQANK